MTDREQIDNRGGASDLIWTDQEFVPPERLWIDKGHIPDSLIDYRWNVKPDDHESKNFASYTRSDLIPAMLASARAEGAREERERCANIADNYLMVETGVDVHHVVELVTAIRAQEGET